MRKSITILASALVAGLTASTVAIAGAASAAPVAGMHPGGAARAASCHKNWGTNAKQAGQMVQTKVRGVRAGEHLCFDRLVIDLGSGARAGYRARYVHQIIADPSGMVVPVRGRGKLAITVMAPAGAHFPVNGRQLADVHGFRTFRQVVGAGSFEGLTSLGLGVRARNLPFRVFELAGPGHRSRLVIDVANQH